MEKPSAWCQQNYLANNQSVRKEKASWAENKGAGPAFSSARLGQDAIRLQHDDSGITAV